MFEQTLLTFAPRKNAAVFAVSLTAQMLGIGTMLLIPLLYTNRLAFTPPSLPLFLTLTPPPPVPTMERHTQQVVPSSSGLTVNRPFRLPIFEKFPANTPTEVPVVGGPPTDIGAPNLPPLGFGPTVFDHIARANLPPPPVAPRPLEMEKPVTLTSELLSAKIIRKVTPVYPRMAVLARVSGTVQLMGIIAKDGTIQNLRTISGHPLLVAAALEAVKQWLYSPTILNGKPVEVIAPIEVVFTLGQ